MRAWAAAAVAALGASTANAAGICKSEMGVQMRMGRCYGVNASDCEVDFEWDDDGFCSVQPYAMSKTVYDQWTAGTSLNDLCYAVGGDAVETKCMDVPMAQGLMDMISGMREKRRAATQQNGTGEEPETPPPDTPPPPPSGPQLYSKEWCSSPAGPGMSVWAAMTWLSLLQCCGDSGETMCYKPNVCGDPTKYKPNRLIGWDCEGLDSTSCSGAGFQWNGKGCEVFLSSSVTDAAATCTSAGGKPKSPKTCALTKARLEGWNQGDMDYPLKWKKTGGSWSTDDCEVASRFVDAGCCGDGASICNTDPADVVLTTASVESALADVGMSAGAPVAGLESLGNLASNPVVQQLASGAQELLFTFAGAASVTEDDKASLAQSVADAVGVAVSRCTVSVLSSGRGRKAVPLEVSLKVTIAPAGGGEGGTNSPVVDVGTTSPAAAAAGPLALATAAAAAFAATC